MATLIITAGPAEGQQFALANHRLAMVGRDSGCTFQIVDPELSRRHLQIKLDTASGGHQVIDAGSANGVFIGRQRVDEPTQLLEGDEIVAGTTKMIYTGHESPDAVTISELLRKRGEQGRSTLLHDDKSE